MAGAMGSPLDISGGYTVKALPGTQPSSSAVDNTNTPQVSPLPPPLPEQPMYLPNVGGPATSVIPKVTGIGNQMMPMGAIPYVAGTMRMNPPLAARFVSINQGGVNYGLGLFCLGYGELVVGDIKIGTTPIDKMPGVVYQVLTGTAGDPAIKPAIFSADVKQYTHNAALKQGTPISKTYPKSAATISVDIGLPNGIYSADAQGTKSATTVDVDVFYRLHGTASSTQQTATNNPAAGSSVVINIPSTTGISVGNWVTVTQTDQYSELALVNSLVVNTSITVATLRKSYTAPKVQYQGWTKVLNGISTNPSISITDNATFSISKSVQFDVPSFGQYDVQVVRLTADSTSTTLVNSTTWKSSIVFGNTPQVVAPKDNSGNTVPIAYIAVKFRASDMVNGQLANLNCLVQRKVSAYSGGTWQTPAVTSSPAWILADILTGVANGRPLQKTDLDGPTFAAFDTFCTANGRQFNMVFDQVTTVLQAAQQVAAVGRGVVLFKDGLYSVAWDDVKSTVAQHFTPRNTFNYKHHMTWPDVPHAIRITFNNSASNYVQDQRIVYADGYNADGSGGYTAATKFETVAVPGITSADQAWREGRYRLAVALNRSQTYEFATDYEGLICDRYDKVLLTNDVLLYGLGSGRIKSVTLNGSNQATAITVDTPVQTLTGSTYGVKIRLSDNTYTNQQIVNTNSLSSTITFQNPITSGTQPAAGDLFAFGLFGQESVECLVKEITYDDDFGCANIQLVDYAPGIFNAETGTIPTQTNQATYQPIVQTSVPIPTLLSWQSDESVMIRDVDGSYNQRIQLVMDQPDVSVQYYETQWKTSDSSVWGPSQITNVEPNVIFIGHVRGGTNYDVRIRARAYDSRVSEWNCVLTNYKAIGDTTPPPDVPVFMPISNDLNLVGWSYDSSVGVTVPLDLAGFQLRYQMGSNSDWDSANIAANLITGHQFDCSQLPQGAMTLMIKAVDVAGNKSTNARYLLRNFGDLATSNVLYQFDQAPTWSGTITNGTVSAGVLTATVNSGQMWTSPLSAMWTQTSALMWENSVNGMSYQWTYTPDWSLFNTNSPNPILKLSLGVTAESWTILYRTGSQAPFWTNNSNNATFWSGQPTDLYWQPDQPWAPWPGQLVAKVNRYDFQINTAFSTLETSTVSSAQTIIDMADVTETLNNVAISASGTRLPITKTYRAITNVSLTALNPGGSYVTPVSVNNTDKSIAGPLVFVYGAFGTPINGVVDAVVQGY